MKKTNYFSRDLYLMGVEQIIGHKLIQLDRVDSTNEELARRCKAARSLPDGLVLTAREQTAGKGLGENAWISEPGMNLLASCYLEPAFLAATEQFSLNMVVSLGVYETVKLMFQEEAVKIKWPNDIYIGRRKVGGILINHAVSGNEILYSIVGIGLNINQTTFPQSLPNPVSLRQVAGHSFDIDRVLKNLVLQLNNYYLLLRNNHQEEIREAYKYALLGYYKWLKFSHQEKEVVARITGISPLGLLELETHGKEKITCDLKEIKFVV